MHVKRMLEPAVIATVLATLAFSAQAGRAKPAPGPAPECIRYEYAVSCILFTLHFQSKVHLVRTADGLYGRGIPYMVASALLGPWSLPWGPLVTLHAIWANSRGGHDVTDEIADWLDTESAE